MVKITPSGVSLWTIWHPLCYNENWFAWGVRSQLDYFMSCQMLAVRGFPINLGCQLKVLNLFFYDFNHEQTYLNACNWIIVTLRTSWIYNYFWFFPSVIPAVEATLIQSCWTICGQICSLPPSPRTIPILVEQSLLTNHCISITHHI